MLHKTEDILHIVLNTVELNTYSRRSVTRDCNFTFQFDQPNPQNLQDL